MQGLYNMLTLSPLAASPPPMLAWSLAGAQVLCYPSARWLPARVIHKGEASECDSRDVAY